MKNLKYLQALIILFLCIIGTDTFAKDYIVEMIFFADKQGSNNYISNQIISPNLNGAIRLDDSAHAHGFVPLPSETFNLLSEAKALARTGRYKVLKHIAWLQPGLAKEDAIPVRIHAGNNYRNEFKERAYALSDFSQQNTNRNQPVNELDGTIKIVLGRYLHVYTDLAYRKLFKLGAGSSVNTLGRDRVLADYAVKTHRKMRSKTLHYIDHPYLGILIEIRPASS